jgi:hypothetical protein
MTGIKLLPLNSKTVIEASSLQIALKVNVYTIFYEVN